MTRTRMDLKGIRVLLIFLSIALFSRREKEEEGGKRRRRRELRKYRRNADQECKD